MQKQITQSDVEQATVDFMIAKEDKDHAVEEFNAAKKVYYDLMDQAFDSGMYGDASSIEFQDQLDTDEGVKDMLIKATRSCPIVVNWDVAALKKRLPRSIAKTVIKRERQLFDLQGLVNYMRSLGGDAKTFWSFFNTTEVVDKDEIDQLSELGELSESDLAGCYSVTVQSSRYRVTSKEVKYDGDDTAK